MVRRVPLVSLNKQSQLVGDSTPTLPGQTEGIFGAPDMSKGVQTFKKKVSELEGRYSKKPFKLRIKLVDRKRKKKKKCEVLGKILVTVKGFQRKGKAVKSHKRRVLKCLD